jgi:hypothetical protein
MFGRPHRPRGTHPKLQTAKADSFQVRPCLHIILTIATHEFHTAEPCAGCSLAVPSLLTLRLIVMSRWSPFARHDYGGPNRDY